MRSIRLTGLALAMVALIASGCSNDGINRGGKLTGTVTVDGKLVTAGDVMLYGEDGIHSVSGKIRTNGTYTVVEPPLGKCKIVVKTSDYKHIPPPGKSKGPVDYTDTETGEWPIYVPTPEKYESLESTDLTVDVESGDQTHDITLTAK